MGYGRFKLKKSPSSRLASQAACETCRAFAPPLWTLRISIKQSIRRDRGLAKDLFAATEWRSRKIELCQRFGVSEAGHERLRGPIRLWALPDEARAPRRQGVGAGRCALAGLPEAREHRHPALRRRDANRQKWRDILAGRWVEGGAGEPDLPLLRLRPLEIEREQAAQGVLGRNVLRPAIRPGDGAVERLVGVGEPARTLVVEIGQR